MLNEVKECATKDICTQTLIERSAIGPRVGRVWDALSTKVVEEAATSAAHLRASVLLRCHLNARSKARSTTIACRSAPRFFLAFSPKRVRAAELLEALLELGFTVPAGGSTYLVGEAMGS